jgi:hypothetical protein
MLVRKFPRRSLFVLLIAALTLAACNMGATPAPTVDVNAINTAANATAMAQISAQLTQTALAAPTNTPLPTDTPLSLATSALPTTATGPTPTGGVPGALPTLSFNTTPNLTPLAGLTPVSGTPAVPAGPTVSLGDSCNNSAWEGDIGVQDGDVLPPGQNFKKTWAVRNTGTCTWNEGYALVYVGGSTPNLDPYDFEFKKSEDFVPGGQGINLTVTLTTPCTPGKYEGHWRMRSDTGYYFGTTLSVYVEVTEKCK